MLRGEQLLQGWAISLLLSEVGQDWSSRRPRLAATASSRAACQIKVCYETRSRITSPGRKNLFTPHYRLLLKCAKSVSIGSFPTVLLSKVVKQLPNSLFSIEAGRAERRIIADLVGW